MLNNTKQTLTYFQSWNKLGGTPGAERTLELDWGRSSALEEASSYWLTPGFNWVRGRGFSRQHTW